MLVITRRLNESILVGDNIRIIILGIDGDRIKIGIEAPASLKILRSELLAEVRDVNREAIAANLTSLASLQGMLCPAGGADAAPVSEAANTDKTDKSKKEF
jgi:carbon storage regulator